MRRFIKQSELSIGLAFVLGVAGLAGCAKPDKTAQEQDAQEHAAAVAMGAAIQKNKLMSQDTYVKVRGLEHQVAKTHTMSDADLDWTLTMLKGADNGIARSRAMTALSLIHPMSDAQKAKILPAIAPFLSSASALDKTYAQKVQQAAQNPG